jgi:POT family proton-dependent oligopeptide transporter
VRGIYQRSIFLSPAVMAASLFKPNISSMVSQLHAQGDSRRDRGFTQFYTGINAGALIAPVLTSILANKVFDTPGHHSYHVVFAASGVGMLISLVWFWFGRRQLGLVGRPAPEQASIASSSERKCRNNLRIDASARTGR